jgi:hypothetical protein
MEHIMNLKYTLSAILFTITLVQTALTSDTDERIYGPEIDEINWELVSGLLPVKPYVISSGDCQFDVNANDVKQCYVRPKKSKGK